MNTITNPQHNKLLELISAILFQEDPIGINFQENSDEYNPEAETILGRLNYVNNLEETHQVIFEEFVSWFGVEDAGQKQKYLSSAIAIWKLWSESKENHS